MSTITTRPRSTALQSSSAEVLPPNPADQRIAIRGVSWELYDRLTNEIGEGQNVHVAYDGRDIEIMTLGPLHEDFKENLGLFVSLLFLELGVNFQGIGQTTWKRPDVNRGLEADLCFYVDPTKLTMRALARARRSNDVSDYPNPDLAIEIDLEPSSIDRAGIYAALKVPEIWRFRDEKISIEQLGADGKYHEVESSRFLYVRPDEIVQWLLVEDSSDKGVWTRRLRAWVQAELIPRARPGA
jgi:Uma2 family endonuclease